MEKDNKDNIKKMLDGITDKANLDASTIQFIEAVPGIVSCCKAVYDEMLKQEFNADQSYDFMKSYMLKILVK